MININNITFAYTDDSAPILRDFSLKIDQGEFICIIGNSGCGKSTLLRLIAGLDFPQEGEITIDSKDVVGTSIERSIVFQQYSLFPWLTVENNIKFALKKSKKFNKSEVDTRTETYLKKVGLYDSRKKFPFQLSGGMRQRTAIARSLALDSEILLMDEPFGALDTKIRKELQDFTRNLWEEDKNKTIILVTHDLNEALTLANRIVFIKEGKIQKDMIFDETSRKRYRSSDYLKDNYKLLSDLEALYE